MRAQGSLTRGRIGGEVDADFPTHGATASASGTAPQLWQCSMLVSSLTSILVLSSNTTRRNSKYHSATAFNQGTSTDSLSVVRKLCRCVRSHCYMLSVCRLPPTKRYVEKVYHFEKICLKTTSALTVWKILQCITKLRPCAICAADSIKRVGRMLLQKHRYFPSQSYSQLRP